MRLILSFLSVVLPIILHAQSYTISGYIKDASTGEDLIACNVFCSDLKEGTGSNTYGFYSLTLPAGEHILSYSYIGYSPKNLTVNLTKDTTIHVQLNLNSQLDVVEVTAERSERIQETTNMSTINLPVAQIKNLPKIGGEVDILKAIQLLPGVQSGSEGSTGLYVRGGGPDQNLILLDGVPVYNANHLFGFMSVFNADAIKNVELIKGGFPARYGGRLSSVVDIRMKEGNRKELKGTAAIGLLSSKFTLEGPIKKDQSSFIVSARRSYIDLFTRPISKLIFLSQGDNGSVGYHFTDLNIKLNTKINDKHKIYLSTYYGDDVLGVRSVYDYSEPFSDVEEIEDYHSGLNWGNVTTAFRWNYQINDKLFANTTSTFSRYKFRLFDNYKTTYNDPDTSFVDQFNSAYNSKIRDFSLKMDFDYIPRPSHYIRFGAQATHHYFLPGVNSYRIVNDNETQTDTSLGSQQTNAIESMVYLEDDWKINNAIKANIGVHASSFNVNGTNYFSVQPRIALRYKVHPSISLKASYVQMTQYLHLLSNSGIGLPTDLWVPPTENIKPQQSWQAAGGLAYSFLDQYELSFEGYYKEMDDMITYKEGASFLLSNKSWEEQVTTGGYGESYGGEFFIHKKKGKYSGWIGYTLSWTTRQFDEINQGRTYAYRFDRRHDISAVFQYKLNDRISISATWIYGTGNAVTIPLEESMNPYTHEHQIFTRRGPALTGYSNSTYIYDERNSKRMPAYHRMDIGIDFVKQLKRVERTWNVSVYNVYNRANPFFIEYSEYNQKGQLDPSFYSISVLPILPAFSYSIKF